MTPSQPLQRPFDRLARAFGKHLPKAMAGQVEPLHQGRVATRRLREILPLCACEVPRGLANRAQRRARRVGRALGGVREIDVSMETVEELVREGAVSPIAAERLATHLEDERDERRERMLERLSSVNTRKLERDLAEIARVLGMRQQTDAWAQELAVRLERRAQRVIQAVQAAGALYISDRVHQVRIAVKKLRYVLELAGETGEAPTKTAVRELKQIQEGLGRLHDLEVLGLTIQDVSLKPSRHAEDTDHHDRDEVGAELEDLRLTLDRECRELHSDYVGKREALLALCQAALVTARTIWIERGGETLPSSESPSAGRVLKMTIPVTDATVRPARGRDR